MSGSGVGSEDAMLEVETNLFIDQFAPRGGEEAGALRLPIQLGQHKVGHCLSRFNSQPASRVDYARAYMHLLQRKEGHHCSYQVAAYEVRKLEATCEAK